MKRLVGLFLSLTICLSLTACQYSVVVTDEEGNTSTVISNEQEVPANLEGPYEVDRVVDGDTIIIDLDGIKTRVRFANIDCPESVAPEESGKENTEEGMVASEFTKGLLPSGSKVYLEYDVSKTDKYDRTLAYVYLDDGETMIERVLLENGFAKVYNDKNNKKYTDEFYKIQDEAKASKIGIWKDQ